MGAAIMVHKVDVYFFLYNVISLFSWAFLANITMMSLLSQRYNPWIVYTNTSHSLLVIQNLQWLELVHSIIGIVRSNPLMATMQIGGRFQCLVFVIFFVRYFVNENGENGITEQQWLDEYIGNGYVGVILMWTLVELIRYPFYISKLIDFPNEWLTFLRYNAFIVLYPIGIGSEILCYIGLLRLLDDHKQLNYSYSMPNAANFEISLKGYIYVFLVIEVIGGISLYSYMLQQRQKNLQKTAKKLKRN